MDSKTAQAATPNRFWIWITPQVNSTDVWLHSLANMLSIARTLPFKVWIWSIGLLCMILTLRYDMIENISLLASQVSCNTTGWCMFCIPTALKLNPCRWLLIWNNEWSEDMWQHWTEAGGSEGKKRKKKQGRFNFIKFSILLLCTRSARIKQTLYSRATHQACWDESQWPGTGTPLCRFLSSYWENTIFTAGIIWFARKPIKAYYKVKCVLTLKEVLKIRLKRKQENIAR